MIVQPDYSLALLPLMLLPLALMPLYARHGEPERYIVSAVKVNGIECTKQPDGRWTLTQPDGSEFVCLVEVEAKK